MSDTKSTGSTEAAGETKPQYVDVKTFTELQKTLEAIKKAQAGSDSKVLDLLKENEALKKEKMTAQEKAEYERKQSEDRIAQKDRELQEREIKLLKVDIIAELELPKDAIDRIRGSNRDELYADAKAFKEMLSVITKGEVTKKLAGSSSKPGGGSSGGAKYEEVMSMPSDDRAKWIQKNRAEWDRMKIEALKRGN